MHPFPRKKSHLDSQGKTAAAAMALLDVIEERLHEKDAARRLREEIGLNWSMITAVQYLSGKEAIGAVARLPADWSHGGRTRKDVLHAIILAADAVNNARPDGQTLCASYLAKHLKGMDREALLAQVEERGAG
ncbi:hypothetical protein [Thermomonas fusca]|uniref:Uncharacterized protein n=1 Tax=Thermomonas fusca TaxID=215690 RepID=A0A5R9PB66_9GAMM|nr:hypothetical protein [Thermomonas fusca]TLX20771.1 hypothetical protein E5S66_13295 [Thermomonas fusca]